MKVLDTFRFVIKYLPKLQSFDIEDCSFCYTTSLSLSSNSIQFYFSIYLPKLQSIETGVYSFSETTSLSLSSNSIQFYFSLYLPQLNQISLGNNSLSLTTSLSLQSTFALPPFQFQMFLSTMAIIPLFLMMMILKPSTSSPPLPSPPIKVFLSTNLHK